MKKIVSVLLAVLLLTSAFSLTVFAEEGADVLVISEDGNYTIDSSVNKPVDKTATDLGTRQPIKTEISFRTDTVNGKVKKVMVKTEEYYE